MSKTTTRCNPVPSESPHFREIGPASTAAVVQSLSPRASLMGGMIRSLITAVRNPAAECATKNDAPIRRNFSSRMIWTNDLFAMGTVNVLVRGLSHLTGTAEASGREFTDCRIL